MPSQVILFKAPLPPHNIASDPYYQLLRKQGYEPTFIPVLEESFEAQEIESVLLGRQGAFDAVIITSRRGAEGWLKAAQSVLETGHGMSGFQVFGWDMGLVSSSRIARVKLW